MMGWFRGRQGHERWEERAHAFADGELGARDHLKFEEHLMNCPHCQVILDGVADLRSELRALQEVEAPRSFRLTPEMVTPKRRAAPRFEQPAWVLRAAQMTAAFAVIGFMAVLTVDFLGGAGDGGNDDSGDAVTMAAPESSGGAEAPNQAAGAEAAATSSADGANSGASTVPTYEGGATTGQGGTLPEATEDAGTGDPQAPGGEATIAQDANRSSEGPVEQLQPLPPGAPENFAPARAEDDDNKRLIRSMEAVLACVAVGAVVLAYFAHRSQEGS